MEEKCTLLACSILPTHFYRHRILLIHHMFLPHKGWKSDFSLKPRRCVRTCCLKVSLRGDQHEHGEVYGRAQEAPQAASSAVHLPRGPALLQLIADPPQARREQLRHGARGSAAAAAGGAGQE